MGGCVGGGSSRAKFAKNAKDLKFIFVVAEGGWDVTQVYATEFDNPNIDMPIDAERDNAGRIDFVNRPNRPAVEDFFKANAQKSLIVNGILVPSLAHDICTKLVLTGTTSDGQADVPAAIGGAQKDDFQLPHVVISGPSFPGDFGTAVTRLGNGLNGLINGSVLSNNGFPTLDPVALQKVQEHVLARAQAKIEQKGLADRSQRFLELYNSSLTRAEDLKTVSEQIDFNQGGSIEERATLAVNLIANKVARCVTISIGGWDTHSDNDNAQRDRFQNLFTGLNALNQALKDTPGLKEKSLDEEVVVVVVSEMGRTPQINGSNGKDHWAYTSALLFGPGITQNRVIGGFDEGFNGRAIDFRSGDVTERGTTISSNNFCASLLNLAGVDHQPLLRGVSPIPAMIG
jgi:hypothetical protein